MFLCEVVHVSRHIVHIFMIKGIVSSILIPFIGQNEWAHTTNVRLLNLFWVFGGGTQPNVQNKIPSEPKVWDTFTLIIKMEHDFYI